jgi:hypothetical protein
MNKIQSESFFVPVSVVYVDQNDVTNSVIGYLASVTGRNCN